MQDQAHMNWNQDTSYLVSMIDDITLYDPSRDRSIPLRIYYPDAAGPFPLILFSHGGAGSKAAFSSLSQFWASQGYLCVHPTHLGIDLQESSLNRVQAVREHVNDPRVWQTRPRDLSFVIDTLPELERELPELRGKIDHSAIGVAGHSFGAYVTIQLAGARIDLPDQPDVSFQDLRASAFLAISPQGPGQYGLTVNSWREIYAPVMMITGTEDRGWDGKPVEWRLEGFERMVKGNKYCLVIRGANHFSFGDRVLVDQVYRHSRGHPIPDASASAQVTPLLQHRIHQYVKLASLTFWDSYLKRQPFSKQVLSSGRIEAISRGEVVFFTK